MPAPDWQKTIDANFADARMFAERLSGAAQYVWLGSFGILYAAMLADKGALHEFYLKEKGLLLVAAALGASAFLFDLLKNAAGLSFANRLERWIREGLAQDPQMNGRMATTTAYNALIAGAVRPWFSWIMLLLSVTAAAFSALAIAAAVVVTAWR